MYILSTVQYSNINSYSNKQKTYKTMYVYGVSVYADVCTFVCKTVTIDVIF